MKAEPSELDQDREKPKIDYPCIWLYKLIGESDVDVDKIVRGVLGEREFELAPSRTSSAGKYQSHNISVVVMDDSDRVNLYETLSQHPGIRMVL